MKIITRKSAPRVPDTEVPAGDSERFTLTPEMHRARVAEIAYFLAEGRGFMPGGESEDWLTAEILIRQQFGKA
ncbi:MAG: DUF2934 domain-containing protein [Acidiferrobacteraceae bacterium]